MQEAIENEDILAISTLLANADPPIHRKALYLAAKLGKVEVVNFLYENCLGIINPFVWWEVLGIAAMLGQLEMIEYIIERHGYADYFSQHGGLLSPLQRASRRGHLDVVKYLIETAGANINWEDRVHSTALLEATETGQFEVVKYLIEKGALLRNSYGTTALIAASKFGHLDLMKYMHEDMGQDLNAQTFGGGWTALISAAVESKFEIVKYLCESGADIHIKNKKGRTALHEIAQAKSKSHIFAYLLENGADVNSQDNDGYTALILASSTSLDNVKLLISKGANVDIMTKSGVSALMVCCTTRDLETVKYLCEIARANMDLECNNGWTPLLYAADSRFYDAVKFLCQQGATINRRNRVGFTLGHSIASTCNQYPVIIDLLKLGMNPAIADNGGRYPHDETHDPFLKAIFKRIPLFITFLSPRFIPRVGKRSKFRFLGRDIIMLLAEFLE